jgi:phosphoesterase RecJ-like protein
MGVISPELSRIQACRDDAKNQNNLFAWVSLCYHNNGYFIFCFGEFAMKLRDLLEYDKILIQCHDNPDADSIASGFALREYFQEKGKQVTLGYSGRSRITKPNLLLMISELAIPIEYIEFKTFDGLIITVDCQYGAGNVTRIEAQETAIIDHHQQEITGVRDSEIRSYLGSCSTLVWQLLWEEGFDVNNYPDISTALYYGLFSDTNYFAELNHPIDRDMKDCLTFDSSLIKRLKNTNLTLSELEIAGTALIRTSYNPKNRFAVVKTNPCDPNILGFISDLAHQVDVVDVCVVYNETSGGIKFSVRSALNEIMASELAAYLAEGIGSGGGHAEKAGGFISAHEFEKKYPAMNADEYLLSRLSEYYSSFVVIHASTCEIDTSDMLLYKKLPVVCGYVRCIDILPPKTPILVRTLECDFDDLVVEDDLYIMIGIKGEVNPIRQERFKKSYRTIDEPFDVETEYFPSIRSRLHGELISLKSHAKKCVSTGESYIYAKPLTKTTKIFTQWDKDTYMLGKPGDYLVARSDDLHDIYIIKKSIFHETYELV